MNTTMTETINDILLVNDLLDDIINESDSHDVEQAVDIRAAIVSVQAKCKLAIDMLDLHLVKVLESPLERSGHIYEIKTKREKIRFDHNKIAAAVQHAAMVEEATGELRDTLEAVKLAVQDMRNLYVSDSTPAKVGGLLALGIKTDDVRTNSWGGKEVRVSPIPSQGTQ